MALPTPTLGPVANPAVPGRASRVPVGLRRNAPWLVLIVTSITFAEFLTGSTPVLVPLLDPLSALFLVGLYGAGVLLVREASIRWNKGWPTILLLGAAYGIAEEGLGTKTFFGPAGVGYLGVYGHFVGVNWVWAVELDLFHCRLEHRPPDRRGRACSSRPPRGLRSSRPPGSAGRFSRCSSRPSP